MKNFFYRKDVKWVAGSLLVLSFLISCFCAVGIFYLGAHGAYNDQGFGLRDELYAELLQQDYRVLSRVIQRYQAPIDGERLQALENALQERFSPKLSNVRFAIIQMPTSELLAGDSDVKEANASLDRILSVPDETKGWIETRVFSSREEAESFIESLSQQDTAVTVSLTEDKENGTLLVTARRSSVDRYRILLMVQTPLTARDKYYYTWNYLQTLLQNRVLIILFSVFFLCLALLLLYGMILGVGHRQGSPEIFLSPMDHIPGDLLLLLAAALILLPRLLLLRSQIMRTAYSTDYLLWFLLTVSISVYQFGIGLAALLSLIRQGKAHVLFRQALIGRFCRFMGACMVKKERTVPILLRALGFFLVLSGGELFFLLLADQRILLVAWGIEKLALGILGAVVAANLSTLEAGSAALSRGETDRKIRLERMIPLLRRHGENLNNISLGMKKTLEEQTRSERMKAELITNVSHDLKTPLTSIVSYVDLMKKVGLEAPEAQEYLEVLDRQSVRLKKLVVDLVEASKASTGNIQVELEPLDLNLLLSQASGEYAERMEARNQELVVNLDEALPPVMADPKLLWRVVDNLLLNAMQYGQPGTRVYLSSHLSDQKAELILRNVSGQPLNISPDELMERFVRGDTSRNTEGSGLGLSIAKSLVELQNGNFRIVIDGDLFKAILLFPLAQG